MPNVAIHLLLSSRVLDCWREGAPAPFRTDDAGAVDAYFLGAVAPDLGFFPPSDRLLSELFHLVRSGDCVRCLVDSAESDLQRAYAWGWATHLLVDLAVHPLINRAARDVVAAGPPQPVDPRQQHTTAHMRVEYGLDAEFFRRYPSVGELKLRLQPDDRQMEWLAAAVREIYGLSVEPRALRAAHRRTGRVSRAGLALNRILTGRLREQPLHGLARRLFAALAPPRRFLPRSYNRSPLVHAVFKPIPPPAWLVEEVEAVLDAFPAQVQQHYDTALAELANYNLMLGELEGDPPTYPTTLQALQALAQRTGRPAAV